VAGPEFMFSADWRKQFHDTDPELVVTVLSSKSDYAVAVEFRSDENGRYVTGVAVRRHRFAANEWRGDRTHISPRDIQRLPLAKPVRAAVAYAERLGKKPPAGRGRPVDTGSLGSYTTWFEDPDALTPWQRRQEMPGVAEARKVLLPRGRPQRGKSTAFYEDIAAADREYQLKGLSPAKEIARRKGVSENTAHQWLYRARKMKFRDPQSSRHDPAAQQKGYPEIGRS
jgi:hypothetical protein